MRLYGVGGVSELTTVFLSRLASVSRPVVVVMIVVMLVVVIVFTSMTGPVSRILVVRVSMAMVMARMGYEVDDITHAAVPQSGRQSLQRKIGVFKVMQSHADRHNVEIVEIRTGVLLRDTLSKQVGVVRRHPVGEPEGLGIAVELVHHVVGDIEADDFGQIGCQGLPAVSQSHASPACQEIYH